MEVLFNPYNLVQNSARRVWQYTLWHRSFYGKSLKLKKSIWIYWILGSIGLCTKRTSSKSRKPSKPRQKHRASLVGVGSRSIRSYNSSWFYGWVINSLIPKFNQHFSVNFRFRSTFLLHFLHLIGSLRFSSSPEVTVFAVPEQLQDFSTNL